MHPIDKKINSNSFNFIFGDSNTKASSTVFSNSLASSNDLFLNVSYTNIRSILNKISFIECYMYTKNLDLFFFN